MIFLLRSFGLSYLDQTNYAATTTPSRDPKNAANQITTLDWIYKNIQTQPFSAFNYVPEIYDYSSHYLYWWYGQKQYGHLPYTISYSLPEVPEYVRSSSKFITSHESSPQKTIALQYENSDGVKVWLNQFNQYCSVSKKTFSWNVTVEIRKLCPTSTP